MPVSAAFILADADAFRRAYPGWPHAAPEPQGVIMSDATADDLEECASCGHHAPPAEMIADLKFNFEPTGKRVCRDADACCSRRLARDLEASPPAWLLAKRAREAERQAGTVPAGEGES